MVTWKLNARARIALGQTGLLISVLLTAALLGLIPDRDSAVRDGRATLAEVLAATTSMQLTDQRIEQLRLTLRLAVERNDGLESIGLRRDDNVLALEVGEHASRWRPTGGTWSTLDQVQIQVVNGADRWGQLELRFSGTRSAGPFAFLDSPWLKLIGYVGLVTLIVFYIYLSKMLKQLDPSQAVPGRVRSALDTLAEGLLVLDSRENVVLANVSFARLMQVEPERLIGQSASHFEWRDDTGEPLLDGLHPWHETIASGQPQHNQLLRLSLPDGAVRTFMVNCSPIAGGSDSSGKARSGVLISLDDVTELEEKEIELRQSKQAAEDANEAKSVFLANMSHEIRTPMNAILGFTEVLRRGMGVTGESRTQHLERIHASGQHLLRLINDILDLSKVEAGRLEIEELPFAAHEIVHETIETLRVKADEKGLGLAFKADGDLPEQIVSDPARLRQILTNLIGNAIKFTDSGRVEVRASVDSGATSGPSMRLAVIDTGVGMTPEQAARVFDPFTQADSSVTRKFGGTGLGLTISRQFARAMGGDIVITSEPGTGSTFTVTIATGSLAGVRWLTPEEAERFNVVEVETSDARWMFPPARVLVVDDGAPNRELVRLVLEEAGLTVHEAENGQVAVDAVAAEPFDLILMDVQMPVMGGFEAVAVLRERGCMTPILALTADVMKGFEASLKAGGFTAYLAKPIDIDVLLRALAGYLDGYQVLDAAAAGSGLSEAAAATDSAKNRDFDPSVTMTRYLAAGELTMPDTRLVSTLSGRSARFDAVIARFVDGFPAQLASMSEAITAGDTATLAQLSHKLKGMAGTVGFNEVSDVAAELELAAKAEDRRAAGVALSTLQSQGARLAGGSASDGGAQASARAEAAQWGTLPTDTSTPNADGTQALRAGRAGALAPTASQIPPDRAPAPPIPSSDKAAGDAATDTSPIGSTLAARSPRAARIVERFLDELPNRMARLDAALADGDHDTAASNAHWLKGAAGTVGYAVLTEPAGALEQAVRDGQNAACEMAAVKALTARLVLTMPTDSAA